MIRHAFAVLVALYISSSVALFGQCIAKKNGHQRYAAAPAPALGSGVQYAKQSRFSAAGDFQFSGRACAGDHASPNVYFMEITSLNLFGSYFSYDYGTSASAAGFSYAWFDFQDNNIVFRIGVSGYPVVMPAVSPLSQSINVGTLRLGGTSVTLKPTVTVALDPATDIMGRSNLGSADLRVKTGVATTLSFRKSVSDSNFTCTSVPSTAEPSTSPALWTWKARRSFFS